MLRTGAIWSINKYYRVDAFRDNDASSIEELFGVSLDTGGT